MPANQQQQWWKYRRATAAAVRRAGVTLAPSVEGRQKYTYLPAVPTLTTQTASVAITVGYSSSLTLAGWLADWYSFAAIADATGSAVSLNSQLVHPYNKQAKVSPGLLLDIAIEWIDHKICSILIEEQTTNQPMTCRCYHLHQFCCSCCCQSWRWKLWEDEEQVRSIWILPVVGNRKKPSVSPTTPRLIALVSSCSDHSVGNAGARADAGAAYICTLNNSIYTHTATMTAIVWITIMAMTAK